MNLYKKEIFKSQLEHGIKWKKHKYLYIDSNGRYVYPEDVKNKAKGAMSSVDDRVSSFISDQQQKRKDKKFVRESNKRYKQIAKEYNDDDVRSKIRNNAGVTSSHKEFTAPLYTNDGKIKNAAYAYNITNPERAKAEVAFRKEYRDTKNKIERESRKIQEEFSRPKRQAQALTKSHQGSTRRNEYEESGGYAYRISGQDPVSEGVKKQIEKTKKRKRASEIANKGFNNNSEAQRKSAHAGYEADKKAFPEGGSTEELERQKKKTANRKKARDTISRTDSTIERMRKKKKRSAR